MPRLLPALFMVVALAGCGTAQAAVRPAASAIDTIWSTGVLAVVRPLAERRLDAVERQGPVADHALLPLGLEALGRADADPRLAAVAVQAWVTPGPQPLPDLDDLCAGPDCSAIDLLQRPELWARPDAGAPGRAGVEDLEPSFRRMAAVLFDRQALLFHTDRGAIGDTHFDAALNATAFAALTRMIDALPDEAPARLEYVALYREMARTITRTQGGDGWWRRTLGDEGAAIEPSASALLVFGLTWGLNTGMLSFNEGEAAALTGWDALRTPAGLEALQAGDAGLGALFLASAQMAERRW